MSARAALLSMALLCGAEPAWGQIVRGKVLEAGSDAPLAQAEVQLLDAEGRARGSTMTDTLGVFQLDAPTRGSYTLTVNRLGYVALTTPVVELARTEAVVVEIRMGIAAIPLEPLVVVDRHRYGGPMLEEFYRRAQASRNVGRGRIYFRSDLERVHSIRQLVPFPESRGCDLRNHFYINGIPLLRDEVERNLDMLVRPDDIEGIEIYRGPAQLPIELQRPGRCGAVLIWTRPATGGKFSWWRVLVGAAAGVALFLFR